MDNIVENQELTYQETVTTFEEEQQNNVKNGKKRFKKVIILGLSVLSLLLIVTIVLTMVYFKSTPAFKCLYMKDNKVYVYNSFNQKSQELTTKLTNKEELTGDFLDDKHIVFSVPTDAYTHSIYSDLKDLYISKNNEENTQIDSRVKNINVCKKEKCIYYLCFDNVDDDESGVLKKYDLNKNATISTQVKSYIVSQDQKRVFYIRTDGDLFIYENGKKFRIANNVKSDSNICNIFTIKDHLYYTDDKNTLYVFNCVDKTNIKICDDFMYLISTYDNGHMYYVAGTEHDAEEKLYKQKVYYYDSNEVYPVSNEFIEDDSYNLYYFSSSYANEKPMAAFTVKTKDNKDQICVAYGKETINTDIIEEDIIDMELNSKKEVLYYSTAIKGNKFNVKLYSVKISDKTFSKAALYDENIYSFDIMQNSVVFYKNVSMDRAEFIGDLYVDKKPVDYDVIVYSDECLNDSEGILYASNYDNKTVTLNLYKDDEITIISDNVCEDDIKVLSNENIVYKTRQGYKKGKVYYNLYLFDGKKSTLIESSISELISVYAAKAE